MLLGTATPSHAKTAYAEMPEVSLRSEQVQHQQQVEQQHVQQQHVQQKPLEVPQVAICPATPQVQQTKPLFFLPYIYAQNTLFLAFKSPLYCTPHSIKGPPG